MRLSGIEKELCNLLRKGEKKGFSLLEKEMPRDQLYRAAFWLQEKGLAEIEERKEKLLELSPEGEKALGKGLIERRLLEKLSAVKEKKLLLGLLAKELKVEEKELNVALGIARKNAWVGLIKKDKGIEVELTPIGEEALNEEGLGRVLEEVKKGGKIEGLEAELNELRKRGLVLAKERAEREIRLSEKGLEETGEGYKIVEEVAVIDSRLIKSGDWKNKKIRKYNVSDPVPSVFLGKKQPYMRFIEEMKRKLTELGFEEMNPNLIELEFYNFDALFQPQNHPARTWTDTYQLKQPSKGRLPGKALVEKVKRAHEKGVSGSRGWGYSWSEEIASRLMPLAHGTGQSARQLAQGISVPGKYFAVARCFRPDVFDATHLIEFNQMEGFVAGEDINFRNLLGMLKEFAQEITSAEKIKFLPDYYPFTEPSVQLNVKHPELGWIELGGSGVFRPEMLEPLGVKVPVIAWGLGIDRLAMFKLGIKDIRQLFSSDLEFLRKEKVM